jgi:excisionase family DNA binding protein
MTSSKRLPDERQPPAMGPDPWLTMDDVAGRLHVHKATVSEWINRAASQRLVGVRLPGQRLWRIRASALEAWLRRLEEQEQEQIP